MPTNTVLVVGGNGIIGRNAVSHLLSTGNWNTLVTSASPLDYETPATYVQLNLLDDQWQQLSCGGNNGAAQPLAAAGQFSHF